MIVRRDNRPSGDTVSVRCTWSADEVRKLLRRVDNDLNSIGSVGIEESYLRMIVGGVMFEGFKPYQAAGLVDWAISLARQRGWVTDVPNQLGKVKVDVK